MQTLTWNQFETLRQGADLVERDRYGEKVLRLTDGSFVKLFRRKTWFSKNTFLPPAKRFARNAEELARLGIPCPQILALYKLKQPYRTAVRYLPLEGLTLRQLLDSDPQRANEELQRLPAFIERLHDLGIYFRSLHLGNIVLCPDGQLGLIDIADLRCLNRPLPKSMRRRNYHHLLRYEKDWSKVSEAVLSEMLEARP